jgi:hypothetical protein
MTPPEEPSLFDDSRTQLAAEVADRRRALAAHRLPLAGNDLYALYRASCTALRRAQPASPLSSAEAV